MSSSESDSDSSGWTLLSREGLDEECVERRYPLRHSDSEEDGAETVPAGAAQSQDNGAKSGADDIGFLEGRLQEASEAGGEGAKGSVETGPHDMATCLVEQHPGPEEVNEEVNEEVGDEMKQEVRNEEVEEMHGEAGKTGEAVNEVVDSVEKEVGNVSEEVMLAEELSVEVSGKVMEEDVSEVVKGELIEKLNQVVSAESEGEVSEQVGEETREVGEEVSGYVQAELTEVGEKMEAVSVKLSELVMEEVKGEVCKVMEELAMEMMEVGEEASDEVSGSDDSDLFTLDRPARDEVPDFRASSDSSAPSPAAGTEEPPRPPSPRSEAASVEPGTRAGSEDALAGSSSVGSHFPLPLARERAPSSAGSSTDEEEDEEKLGRCDGDEARSGPPAPRLRRRLSRRPLAGVPADGAAPDTEDAAPGMGAMATVMVPALVLALIVALGLVIASNHVASARQGVLVRQNERLREVEDQLQAEAAAAAKRWEAERGALFHENSALRATLARLREDSARASAATKQELPAGGPPRTEASGAAPAAAPYGQDAARAAARELAAEGRRLQTEVRRLHRELREERAASAAARGERDGAAAALEAERQRSRLWERLYVEARDSSAAERGKKKKAEGARGPDGDGGDGAKNSTGRHGERGAGREASDANRGRGWAAGHHANAGAGAARGNARADARDARRAQGQAGGRRGEERLKMKGRDWRGPEEYGTRTASSARAQGRNTKHGEQHDRCHEQHKQQQQQQSYRGWHGKPRRHCDLRVAEVEIELGPLPFGPKY